MPYTAFWGRSAGQMNVTRIWFAGYINEGTAAGINALRRLKIKRCGELALRLSSRLTFAWGDPLTIRIVVIPKCSVFDRP